MKKEAIVKFIDIKEGMKVFDKENLNKSIGKVILKSKDFNDLKIYDDEDIIDELLDKTLFKSIESQGKLEEPDGWIAIELFDQSLILSGIPHQVLPYGKFSNYIIKNEERA